MPDPNILTSLLDLLFPPTCLGCGKVGRYFCPACRPQIKLQPHQICPVCLRPAINGLTHPRCPKRNHPDGLVSVFSYQGIIRKAITTLKYKPYLYHLSEELINLTLKQLNNVTIEQLSHYLLAPVPLHWFRRNQRGFNQSALLGKKLSQKLKITFLPNLLIRRRYTRPQTKLTKDLRLQNIHGAFKLNLNSRLFASLPKREVWSFLRHQRQAYSRKLVKCLLEKQNLSVMLFDDVWTTGATMHECTRVLKQSGFKKVFCLTIAR